MEVGARTDKLQTLHYTAVQSNHHDHKHFQMEVAARPDKLHARNLNRISEEPPRQ